MTNDKWTMTNRSQKCGQRTAICHFSLVICQISLCGLCGREKKCIAGFQPAKVVLTQKELSRLRCRRDAGATIFSHDLCLRGSVDNQDLLRSARSLCFARRIASYPPTWTGDSGDSRGDFHRPPGESCPGTLCPI